MNFSYSASSGGFIPGVNKFFGGYVEVGREHDLAAILSQVQSRVVTNDYTLRFEGQSYRVEREGITAGLRGSRVRVERRLDGTLAVRFRGRYRAIARCEVKAQPLPVPRRAAVPAIGKTDSKGKKRTRWMEGFDLRRSPPLWAAIRAERNPASTPAEPS